MFKTRLLSGIVLVIAAIFLIVTGNEVLLFSTLLISCIGMFELFRVFKFEKSLLSVVPYIALILFYINLRWSFIPDVMMLFMGFLIVLMFVYMLSYVYQIRTLNNGLYLAFLVFLCSWGCDTCAYCVGVLIGKHKMAPKLSPKKSIEGAVGGVLGSALLTALYCFIFRNHMNIDATEIAILAVIAAVAGLISMVGDLCASAIKRNYDIKDYGHLIPGHGGILDRFDSMIITAPIIYYLASFFLS